MKQWTLFMSKCRRGFLDSKKRLQCTMLCIAMLIPGYVTANAKAENPQESFLEAVPTDNSVRGTIIDEQGVPIPGVSVVIKGTSTGVISDINGYYIIDAKPGDVLVFSFIGFKSQEIVVDKKPSLDVVLKEDVNELEATVVVGRPLKKKLELKDRENRVFEHDSTFFTFRLNNRFSESYFYR